ncbi:phage head closure protein [Peribacillus sp. JNUCC 23]
MIHDEYPHKVTFQSFQKIPDGAGGYTQAWINVIVDMDAFCDSPTTQDAREMFLAQQLTNPFDRVLFYEYRTDINEKMRCVFENEIYELAARPSDQGGAHEIMRVPLKLVRNG